MIYATTTFSLRCDHCHREVVGAAGGMNELIQDALARGTWIYSGHENRHMFTCYDCGAQLKLQAEAAARSPKV